MAVRGAVAGYLALLDALDKTFIASPPIWFRSGVDGGGWCRGEGKEGKGVGPVQFDPMYLDPCMLELLSTLPIPPPPVTPPPRLPPPSLPSTPAPAATTLFPRPGENHSLAGSPMQTIMIMYMSRNRPDKYTRTMKQSTVEHLFL